MPNQVVDGDGEITVTDGDETFTADILKRLETPTTTYLKVSEQNGDRESWVELDP